MNEQKYYNNDIIFILGDNLCGEEIFYTNWIQEQISGTVVDNLDVKNIFENIKFSKRNLELFDSMIFADRVIVCNGKIKIIDSWDGLEYSDKLQYLASLMCKNADALMLDKPESGLNKYEEGLLLTLLNYIRVTFKKVICITKSEQLILGISNKKVYITEKTNGIAKYNFFEVPEDKVMDTYYRFNTIETHE